MMGNFPVYFDHVQMVLWRVFVVIEREIPHSYDETGEICWGFIDEINEIGTFLSKNMAKVHYDSVRLCDFVSVCELESGFISQVTVKYEAWYIDECNSAQYKEEIENKKLY